ncbi:MAG: DUF262 domain-containing protein [Tepidisphaera sp.]
MNPLNPAEPVVTDIPSEVDDAESSPASYEIVTYPADFTLEGLVGKFKKRQIVIPDFQREYVWTIKQASRLIESFLLGLPVPSLFLYTDPEDNSQLVIDGQQRLVSAVYFLDGIYCPDDENRRRVFKLTGLSDDSPFAGMTYEDLRRDNPPAFNKLNDAVLRAFVIKQLNPNDSTSIYHIFERLNTGGTILIGQEIRNCVYHGPFNDLLNSLNLDANWRLIYGKPSLDNRMRDAELVLRGLALYYNSDNYQKPMKDFLSKFMKDHRRAEAAWLESARSLFVTTAAKIVKHLGARPFHSTGLSAPIYDAVFVAFAGHREAIPEDIKARYLNLLKNEVFVASSSYRTTDVDEVEERLETASSLLFGAA